MPQARDEAGNVWETDAQGNAVRLIAPAGAGQVFDLPPSAKDQRAEQREAAVVQDRVADNARADSALDLRRQLAGLDAELKRAQIEKARGGSGGEKLRDRLSRLNQLVGQINRVQTLYDENIGTTKGLAGLQDYLPTNDNARFDAAGAALSQQGLAAFRVPGTGTVSDRDAIMFDRANLPTAATRDSAIEEQLLGLRSRVEAEMAALGQEAPSWSNGQQAENELDKAATFNDPSPPDLPPVNQGGNDPTPMTPASGGGIQNIARPDINSMVQSMMAAGAGFSTINAALKAKNASPIGFAEFDRAKKWMAANPGKAYPVNAQETRDLTMLERLAGSSLGAGLANYANSATAGLAGAVAGEQSKGALAAMQAVNPGASLTGNILGGVTGAAGGEMLLGAKLAGTAAAKFAPRLSDLAFGATTGFNAAEDGAGLEGAALGGVTGVIGGAVGEGAMRAAGGALRGVTNPAVARLRALGVPVTVGQAMGGTAKSIEEALTSLPGAGNMVSRRFNDAREGMNRAAFEIGAETTGGQVQDIGAAGIRQLAALKDAAYKPLDNVTMDFAEPQLAQDVMAAQLGAAGLPNGVGDSAVNALDYRVSGAMGPDGIGTGRDFQEAYRGLGRDGRVRQAGGYQNEFAGAMREGQDALAMGLERQNPGAFDQFINANTANRRLMVLADAVDKAKKQGGTFTPYQLNAADASSATKLTGKVASAGGDRPFAQLAEDAESVLGSTINDSGTFTRALVGTGLTGGLGAGGYAVGGGEGAGTGTMGGLALAGLLAAGGTKNAQRLAVSALLDRPEALTRAGKILADLAKFGGGVGAGTAAPLLVGQ